MRTHKFDNENTTTIRNNFKLFLEKDFTQWLFLPHWNFFVDCIYVMYTCTLLKLLKRTYQMNVSKRPAISGQTKYFELRILICFELSICKHWKTKDSKQITIICPTKDDSLHGNFLWTRNIWSLGNILILSAL